jgi:DNA-directed RNA polymerase specialized sigma24 family protein
LIDYLDVSAIEAIPAAAASTMISTQDELYRETAETYGGAMERLARAYEADADLRRDLVQEIHVALWRSFRGFDGRCSVMRPVTFSEQPTLF